MVMANSVPQSPYSKVMLSGPLTATQEAALVAADADLKNPTDGTNQVSVGGQSNIPAYDLGNRVRVQISDVAAETSVTAANSLAYVRVPGLVTSDLNLDFVLDTTQNNTFDLLLKDKSGTRVVYLERTNSKKRIFIGTILDRQELERTEGGETRFTVKMGWASHAAVTDWE